MPSEGHHHKHTEVTELQRGVLLENLEKLGKGASVYDLRDLYGNSLFIEVLVCPLTVE